MGLSIRDFIPIVTALAGVFVGAWIVDRRDHQARHARFHGAFAYFIELLREPRQNDQRPFTDSKRELASAIGEFRSFLKEDELSRFDLAYNHYRDCYGHVERAEVVGGDSMQNRTALREAIEDLLKFAKPNQL